MQGILFEIEHLVPDPEARDYWSTPDSAVKDIVELTGIQPVIDACANEFNYKFDPYITEEMDALKTDWIAFAKSFNLPPIFWMNPPYSSGLIEFFLQKALEESRLGAIVVSLLPPSIDLHWWHEYVKKPRKAGEAEMEELEGRIEFIPPPGVKPSSPRRGNVVVVYGIKNKRLLCPKKPKSKKILLP